MNLLTDTWVVEGWLIGLPWVLFVLAACWIVSLLIGLSEAKQELRKYADVPGQWTRKELLSLVSSDAKRREKAEAEARELQTALDERLNKLRAADFRCGELERKVNLLESPRTGKNGSASLLSTPPVLGNPAKKGGNGGKKAPVKKMKVSVAKRKSKG